jgi:hypothetical protein
MKKVARTNGNYETLMRDLDYPMRNTPPLKISTGTTRLNHDQLALVMLGYFQQLVKLFRETNGDNNRRRIPMAKKPTQMELINVPNIDVVQVKLPLMTATTLSTTFGPDTAIPTATPTWTTSQG